MEIQENHIGRFVLIGITGTVALRFLAVIYQILSGKGIILSLPTAIGIAIGVALTVIVLRSLWLGKNWARYLLDFCYLVAGIVSSLITLFSVFDSESPDLILLPISIWYSIIGALLIWAPGISSYMRARRHL